MSDVPAARIHLTTCAQVPGTDTMLCDYRCPHWVAHDERFGGTLDADHDTPESQARADAEEDLWP
jgi:hypothetical protein